MGVIGLISKGFGVATRNSQLVLLLFAVGFVWALINIPLAPRLEQANVALSLAVLALTLAFIGLNIFLQAGALSCLRDTLKSGQAGMASFSASAKKYFSRFLGISAIIGLYIIILSVLATLVLLLGGETPSPVSVVVAVVIAALGLLGLFFVFLAPYALIIEDAKVIECFRKSIALVKANFLKLLFLGVLLILIAIGISVAYTMVSGLIGTVLKGAAGQIVFGLISSLVNAYLGLAISATFMAYYLSARSGATVSSRA